jgi:hypothetical protein
MNEIETSLPDLSKRIEQRLALLRTLAESLESSTLALARNDAEAIARGAAHQAELCLQWSRVEDDLRRETARGSLLLVVPASTLRASTVVSSDSLEFANSALLQAEWEALRSRIRYLTRVHWSLLRHLERSLAVMNRVVNSCAATYTADPGLLRPEVLRADVRLRAGE